MVAFYFRNRMQTNSQIQIKLVKAGSSYTVEKLVGLFRWFHALGIESILDSRNDEQKGKLYFVKYKGLAHIHNLWIPKSQLLMKDSTLLTKFAKKQQRGQVTVIIYIILLNLKIKL